ncbi:LemA family protein [Candidatus Magnetomoraceae bacterium gMMP-15]
MDDWLPKLIAPALAAIIAAYVGFIHGRWSRHKEIIYQKKVEIYSELVSQLLEFTMLCASRKNLTFNEYSKVVAAFTETQNAFFRASLFMPEQLHNDIRAKFTPANERLAKINTTFDRLKKIKKGAKEEDLGVKDFTEFKEQTIGAFDDLKEFPGPFMPLIEASTTIVGMLKRDLGISILDAKFYQRKP